MTRSRLVTKLRLEGDYDKAMIGHRVLIQMEGTEHIDLSRFETTESITFKILPLMHM